jgi:Holliday junction resolvasome RuvABC endonuclease subunit
MILGIDASSKKIAVCVFRPPKKPVIEAISLGKKFDLNLIYNAYAWMGEFLATISPEGSFDAFIEQPLVAGARNIQSTLKQALVNGGIQVALFEWDAVVMMVPPSSWKAEIGAGGNATKERVQRAIRERWPDLAKRCGGDEDCFDATGVALYGEALVRSTS